MANPASGAPFLPRLGATGFGGPFAPRREESARKTARPPSSKPSRAGVADAPRPACPCRLAVRSCRAPSRRLKGAARSLHAPHISDFETSPASLPLLEHESPSVFAARVQAPARPPNVAASPKTPPPDSRSAVPETRPGLRAAPLTRRAGARAFREQRKADGAGAKSAPRRCFSEKESVFKERRRGP